MSTGADNLMDSARSSMGFWLGYRAKRLLLASTSSVFSIFFSTKGEHSGESEQEDPRDQIHLWLAIIVFGALLEGCHGPISPRRDFTLQQFYSVKMG